MPPEPPALLTSSFLGRLPEAFTIYLVRHATPDRSRYDIAYHILPGPDLTTRGEQEAIELGFFLHNAGTAFILSSPFERARRTALIASEIAGAPVELNNHLAERQPIEPEAVLVERMQKAFEEGARYSAQRGPVALVTHGSPVLVLLKSLGLPLAVAERCRIYDNRNLIPMAGVWRVTPQDGGLLFRPVFAPQGILLPQLPEETASTKETVSSKESAASIEAVVTKDVAPSKKASTFKRSSASKKSVTPLEAAVPAETPAPSETLAASEIAPPVEEFSQDPPLSPQEPLSSNETMEE